MDGASTPEEHRTTLAPGRSAVCHCRLKRDRNKVVSGGGASTWLWAGLKKGPLPCFSSHSLESVAGRCSEALVWYQIGRAH